MGFFSFAKADRILKRSEFIQLSQTGKKIQNRYFIVVFSPGQFERSRLGVTVTKKVGCSVRRNRIKRLSREYFRLNRDHLKGNWDINIIAKKEANKLQRYRFFASLDDILNKISPIYED